jgi:hypothetical protein
VRRELGKGRDRGDGLRVLCDVAPTTALRDQTPPGSQRLAQPGEEPLVIEDPVEGRGRED